jgi:hypothetical protein
MAVRAPRAARDLTRPPLLMRPAVDADLSCGELLREIPAEVGALSSWSVQLRTNCRDGGPLCGIRLDPIRLQAFS